VTSFHHYILKTQLKHTLVLLNFSKNWLFCKWLDTLPYCGRVSRINVDEIFSGFLLGVESD
jgi:hypothetical protein